MNIEAKDIQAGDVIRYRKPGKTNWQTREVYSARVIEVYEGYYFNALEVYMVGDYYRKNEYIADVNLAVNAEIELVERKAVAA